MSQGPPSACAEPSTEEAGARSQDTQPAAVAEDAPVAVAPGAVLAGKYLLERTLGEGGMAVVFRALHLELREQVAIKVLRPEAARQADVVTRFLREARALARLRSEHVAQVHDVGHLEDGTPWFVMELLDGRDLATELDERGCLPVDEAIDLAKQVCEAMAKAHARGIVHRDLKPANLFLTRRPDGARCVKVIDFGIAKTAGLLVEGDASLTASTVVLGSPTYMSPEQVRSPADVDERTDVWSLGVILYEALAGRPPFAEATPAALLAAIAADEPVPLRALRPDAPAWLEAVVARCLRKRPHERPASARALADRLVEGAESAAVSEAESRRAPSAETTSRVRSPARLLAGAAVLGAVVLGLASAFRAVPSTGVLAAEAATSPAAEASPAGDVEREPSPSPSSPPAQPGTAAAAEVPPPPPARGDGRRVHPAAPVADLRPSRARAASEPGAAPASAPSSAPVPVPHGDVEAAIQNRK